MAGQARAARANLSVLRAAVSDYEKAREALSKRDLNAEERERLEGELEREVRDRLLELRQKSQSLVEAAAGRVAELSPAARRRRAAFKSPDRAAAVAQWLDGATPDDLMAFAKEAAAREDDAALAGVSRAAATVEGLDPQALSEVLNRPDDDYTHARSELIVARHETAALDTVLEVAGLGTGPTALAAAHEASAIEVEGATVHIKDKERKAAYERLDIAPGVAPAEWPEPERGVLVPPEPVPDEAA